ncbi:MAG: hypothetical protein QXP60_05625 [Nitrososphaerota archaeon]
MDVKSNEDILDNPQADYAVVVFGFVDENNYRYLIMNSSAGYTQIFNVVSGSRVAIATSTVSEIPEICIRKKEVNKNEKEEKNKENETGHMLFRLFRYGV